ncbi:SRR1-like protein isoform X1 [Crotalus tigris]|uniref:SRR1-like protein isoform X1 n=1 Tax=Crotalus tigris TaxID=88082 RepID=UPI00192F8DE3|nr:SRR1-like protein isoform X1 [Crotalus tigris]
MGAAREEEGGGGGAGGRGRPRTRAPRRRLSGRGGGCRRRCKDPPKESKKGKSSELKDSDFWDSSRRTILKSLGTPPTAEQDAFAALGELQEALPGKLALGGPGGRARGLRCVCYGLGNFCSCGKARLQLAFLLLLLEELKIPPEMCFVFDPIFSTLETEVLGGLGLTVLQWNEEGKRSIEGPTLFYMIHCGKALYNNLLWSNWSAEALSQMVVVGNSFRGFEERLLAKVFRENYSYIAKVLEASQEEALPPHPLHPDVFNDTSVHRFPLQKLRGLPQECWACQPEPFYPEEAQLEIIRNKPQ